LSRLDNEAVKAASKEFFPVDWEELEPLPLRKWRGPYYEDNLGKVDGVRTLKTLLGRGVKIAISGLEIDRDPFEEELDASDYLRHIKDVNILLREDDAKNLALSILRLLRE